MAKPKAKRKRKARAPAPSDLSPGQIAEIVRAEAACRRAKIAHEHAEAERRQVRERYFPYFPVGEDVEVHGVELRIIRGSTGERFSLAAARKAGHELPPHLHRFVTPAKDTYTWRLNLGESLADGVVKLAA
jgi:hypothetical protein